MNIALYIGELTMENGGAFMYAQAVAKMLVEDSEVQHLFLLVSEDRKDIEVFPDYPKTKVVKLKNNFVVRLRSQVSRFLLDVYDVKGEQHPMFYTWGILFNPLRRIIDQLNVDVVHVPFQVSPVYGLHTPLVVSMHDVQELHFPEFFSSHTRLYRSLYHRRSLEYADHVIVSFSHIKEDLIKYFHFSESKIDVCPIPLTGSWLDTMKSNNSENLRKKYHLPDEFILYPAQTWRHKNHLRLVQALKMLQAKGSIIHLVCTGGLNEYYKELRSQIDLLDMQHQVHFLNIVPEEDLVGLYQLARLVVIPTLYEAGSAPLFEAMRYGIPVICSRVTSLPESIGSDGFTFDPMDIAMMADKIFLGWHDEDFRKRNIENSKHRLTYYQKLNYSSRFLNAYRNAIERKKSKSKEPATLNAHHFA